MVSFANDDHLPNRGGGSAPSATAGALRDATRASLAAPTTRIREPNTMPNVFDLPNPFPDNSSAPQTPNRQPPNIKYLTPGGRNPNDIVDVSQSRTAGLFATARRTNDLADRSAFLREAMASAGFDKAALSSRTDLETAGDRNTTLSDIANLRSQVDTNISRDRNSTARDLGALDSEDKRFGITTRDSRAESGDNLRARTSRANTTDTLLQRALADSADLDLRARALDQKDVGSYTLADHFSQLGVGFLAGSPGEINSLQAARAGARTDAERSVIDQMIRAADQALGVAAGTAPQRTAYAEGGIVEPAAGAPVLGPQQLQPDPALMAKYSQYAEGSRAMGLSTVGFEEFAQMSQGAAAAAGTTPPTGAGAPVALSEGGEVPAGGKMVIDSDPNAPTDSIPAIIDGQTPAALDSGELVFPRHAVLYYGTDKLNKMIAKSQEAEGGNGESATGLNG